MFGFGGRWLWLVCRCCFFVSPLQSRLVTTIQMPYVLPPCFRTLNGSQNFYTSANFGCVLLVFHVRVFQVFG